MNAGGPYTHPAEPSWVSVLTPNLFDAKRSTSASERKKKKTKKNKNQQFRTVEFWIITSVRSARAEQNSQLSFFKIFRSTTDNFVWIGFQLMDVWRGLGASV
jgi:hypothetical protein